MAVQPDKPTGPDRLFTRALDGDTEAFWRLLDPHRRAMHAVAYGVVKDVERAQDIVHDTYVRAFSTLGNLRSPDKLGGWLCSMARNVAHEQIRKAVKQENLVERTNEAEVVPVTELMMKEEELRELEAALAELPEAHRVVLGLKYMSHMSCKEIADSLGIGTEAAKSRLFEARKLLRRRIEAARKRAAAPLPVPSRRGVQNAEGRAAGSASDIGQG